MKTRTRTRTRTMRRTMRTTTTKLQTTHEKEEYKSELISSEDEKTSGWCVVLVETSSSKRRERVM